MQDLEQHLSTDFSCTHYHLFYVEMIFKIVYRNFQGFDSVQPLPEKNVRDLTPLLSIFGNTGNLCIFCVCIRLWFSLNGDMLLWKNTSCCIT